MAPGTLLYRIEPPLYVWNDPLDIPLPEGAIGRLSQGHPGHHYATDPSPPPDFDAVSLLGG
jgi:hypothetical protein